MFNTPAELIEDIRQGKIVILVDDEDRENEGDLVLAADHVTPALINFMAVEARGLICLALAPEQIEKLQLPLMVRDESNHSPNKTAFTVSIEASHGVTTGISAADRAHTIRVAASPSASPSDVHMPGHVFPIRAQQGGVLKRAGHTEGSVDLARLAGLNPAAVICEVMNPDGTMARVPDLLKFAKTHQLKIGTIVDLIEYRLSRDILVEEILDLDLPSEYRGFRARVFKSRIDGVEHLVLQKGEITADKPTLVRMQLDSYTRDMMNLLRGGSSALLAAIEHIEKAGEGILVLLRGNNKASGLHNEIRSLADHNHHRDMDRRDYGVGAQILRALGVHQLRLLSNRMDRLVGLKAYNLEILEVVGLYEEENEAQKSSETENRDRHITLQ